EEDYMETIPEGFVVWTRDGVLDTAGPMAAQLLEKWNVSPEQVEYLKKRQGKPPVTGDFNKNWFFNLCHNLAATEYEANAVLHNVAPLPVFSSRYIRRLSRRGYEQNLEWVSSWKVKVLDKVQIKDFVFQSRQLKGFEIISDWSGMI